MEKKKSVIKDGLIGMAIGTAAIIPGISGATIALIFGAFKKIVEAVSNLLSKNFWKNLLILLPFGIGAVLAVAGLIYPFQLAFEYCMFAIVCLFASFIIGSFPSLFDNVRGKKVTKINIVVLIIGFIIATMIGVFSILFKLDQQVEALFAETPVYLYFILLGLGIISASGLTVPGFSASMFLLVVGFYKPILNLVNFAEIASNPGRFIGLIGCFAIGVVIGFFLISYLMNYLLEKHEQSTHYAVIGFVAGSLVAIFANSDMITYLTNLEAKTGFLAILDLVLTPIFVIIGLFLATLLTKYARKCKAQEEIKNAQN